jgi:hypothetical protein
VSPPRVIHTVESLQARTIEEGDCWLWQGYHQNGTPQVMHYPGGKRRMYSVRRLFRELQAGRAMPDGHYGNTCGNPQCVSPDHTIWKTTKTHLRDLSKRRTHTVLDSLRKRQVRIDRGLTKLDMDKAQAIRASTESSRVLAEQYGVHQSLIKRIRNNGVWRVLSGPFAGLFR